MPVEFGFPASFYFYEIYLTKYSNVRTCTFRFDWKRVALVYGARINPSNPLDNLPRPCYSTSRERCKRPLWEAILIS